MRLLCSGGEKKGLKSRDLANREEKCGFVDASSHECLCGHYSSLMNLFLGVGAQCTNDLRDFYEVNAKRRLCILRALTNVGSFVLVLLGIMLISFTRTFVGTLE